MYMFYNSYKYINFLIPIKYYFLISIHGAHDHIICGYDIFFMTFNNYCSIGSHHYLYFDSRKQKVIARTTG